MPEWIFGGLVTLAGAAIAASGMWLGSILQNRTAARTAQKSGENALIDQLQEELVDYRKAEAAERLAATNRANTQDERMNRLEKFSDGYRNLAHEYRAHIWDGNPPPPPEWPEWLPR